MNLEHTHQHDHVHIVEDFRKRFWLSLVLTLPILILSPTIQEFVGFSTGLRFAGDQYFLWAFSSIVFFYGGFTSFRRIGKAHAECGLQRQSSEAEMMR